MDPFSSGEETSAKLIPLLVGFDTLDFIDKVNQLYTDEKFWTEYSYYGALHAQEWFGKMKATKQLDDYLQTLNSKQ